MIILGIDPGTTTIGFALVEKKNSIFKLLDYGVFTTAPKLEQKYKLLEIGTDIKSILDENKPDLIVIEKLFFQTNVKTAITVAESRGVIIYEAIKTGIEILEYTPLQVKKAVTGNGQAKKIQLQNAIKMLFGLDEIPKPDDAADAIGLAYMGALENNRF